MSQWVKEIQSPEEVRGTYTRAFTAPTPASQLELFLLSLIGKLDDKTMAFYTSMDTPWDALFKCTSSYEGLLAWY